MGGSMQDKKLLQMVRTYIADIVQPELEKQGFKMNEETVEGEREWLFFKNGKRGKPYIELRVPITKTINITFIATVREQFKVGSLDHDGDLWKEVTGYPFDSEESFKEQLKFLLNLTLEKGIPKMNELISKEQANKVGKQ